MAATSNIVTDQNPRDQEKPFRLLDLPAEIWSKIGKLAIDNTTTLTASNIKCLKPQYHGRSSYDRSAAIQPAITRTCRALRYELLHYYYRTTIAIHTKDGEDALELDAIGDWLRSIGAVNRRCVSGVTVSVEYDDASALKGLRGQLRGEEFKGVEFKMVKVRSHVVDGDGYAWDKYKFVFL
ncbi:hypothetical protein CLAFUW4_13450 [Fulvia fulva]|uniref:Uncharacterized protein n=1 Tax=Passalora fulva TaxID=5499 RepID=A0A9Q8PJU5_PASFU|nr:hypothetical protein CLAFUR4_13453 [Fulvia fulva]KAK4612454.1 hypothetical protein CLAFUR0_13461 [Fulvia fulva]WPV20939.1 hypothetical protein CLAFUW4_13450 [Fulvia fulva]WPV36228.1 hypothetical protein CLAFUW7_13457 [Fulvia fulva]